MNDAWPRHLGCVLVFVLAACGPEEEPAPPEPAEVFVACDIPELCGGTAIGSEPNEQLYACFYAALRDRSPGRYNWKLFSTIVGSDLFIGQSGEAVLWVRDIEGEMDEAYVVTLKDPAFFDACLAESTISCEVAEWYASVRVLDVARCPE